MDRDWLSSLLRDKKEVVSVSPSLRLIDPEAALVDTDLKAIVLVPTAPTIGSTSICEKGVALMTYTFHPLKSFYRITIKSAQTQSVQILLYLGDHIQGTNASPIDVQISTVAAEIFKAILRGDEDLASQLISDRDSALSQSDLNSVLQSCRLFNAPSLVESLLQRGVSLSASTYNERTPLHFVTQHNFLKLTKLFLKHGATIDTVDSSGYTPLDLTIGGGLANIETTKYLVEYGVLATQGRGDTATETSMDPTLEGHWEGTYSYDYWQKGRVDATVLTIRFAPSSLSSKHPFWKGSDRDKIGMFDVLGHLFADNAIRFAKL